MHSLCIVRSVSYSVCVLVLRVKWADGPGNFALLSLETGRNTTAYAFLMRSSKIPESVRSESTFGDQFTGTSEEECCFGARLGILEDGINDGSTASE